MIAIIAAMGSNRVIGRAGRLPWHIPADMRRFRELTLGHTVIMGRKTFAGIGRALPERRNIVLSRNPDFHPLGALSASSLEEALALAGGGELFICGGEEVYCQALGIASRIYLTVVELEEEGDAFFPEIPAGLFVEVAREIISQSPPAELITLERCGVPRP